MASSSAKSVAAYLTELPEDRRAEIATVLKTLRGRMPAGYRETMGYGMIMWGIPLDQYPDTYNGHPLCYAALAAQKNYSSIYLMCVYGDPTKMARLKQGFAQAGKKLDMGKACIRFKRAAELPLEVIGDLVAEVPPAAYISRYEKSRELTAAGKRAKAASAGKPARGALKPKATKSTRRSKK
jgi:hypothetical protein